MYKIIRYKFKKGGKVIKRGLTLEQAQAHCEDSTNRGEGWFDGWTLE